MRIPSGMYICVCVQICRFLQINASSKTQDQNAHIEHYVNARFSPRPLALPDFLADLQSERASVNAENCRADAEALHALWLSAMVGFRCSKNFKKNFFCSFWPSDQCLLLLAFWQRCTAQVQARLAQARRTEAVCRCVHTCQDGFR